ncbi:probetacellulin [Protobothrops mucrosquamatus]|uniref:probetacellulin n=1 Tax=Protobothrops mucrosquamatus TaxID=103944 RepID=UPI0007758662|nr:probetacellulin [Protobothrops mucrosquamatus]
MTPDALLGSGPLLLLGIVIFSSVTSSENATVGLETKKLPCDYMNGTCTDGTTDLRLNGHFSECPEEYKHFCVKGRCRYVDAVQTPSCICERGYTGERCERLDLFHLRGDQGQIVVVSLIAVMVMLIILIACICTCTHYCRKKRRKRKQEKTGTYDNQQRMKTDDILEMDIE